MRLILATSTAAAILCGTAASALAPAPLKAGRWKEKIEITKMTVGDDILPFEQGEERIQINYRCLAKPDPASSRDFLESQMPRQYCTDIVGSPTAGKIAMTGRCNMGSGPSKVTMNGNYGGTAFDISVRNEMPSGPQTMVLHSTVEGRFEGPCRGDERP